MTNFLWFAAVSAVINAVLTALISRWARRTGAFTPPLRERDIHHQPTPRVGGIALILTFFIMIGLILIVAPERLSFTGIQFLGIDRNLFGLLLATFILALINIKDDQAAVRWEIKLAVQIIAALIIVYFGIKIQFLSNPFGHPFVLGDLNWLFVVIWLVVIGNVVNWLDSSDGVAGGVSGITLIILFFLSIRVGVDQPENALLAAIGVGAILAFLPFNFAHRAFLGDTGSIFLGFLIGVLAIISGGKVTTAFLVLAIPFLDAVVVFFGRLIKGHSPFLPDHRHLIHRLLEVGWQPWHIVIFYYFTAAAFGLVALNTQSIGKFWAVLAALGVMTSLVVIYSIAARKKSARIRG